MGLIAKNKIRGLFLNNYEEKGESLSVNSGRLFKYLKSFLQS